MYREDVNERSPLRVFEKTMHGGLAEATSASSPRGPEWERQRCSCRVLSEIPLVRSILQTIWHQINGASQVFVVGTIQADNTVRGGTGWGAELARLWKKPLFVYDQPKRSWFRWSGSAWEIAHVPIITSEAFAGIGTQNLTDDGREAIRDLFLRGFGDPSG